MQPHSISVVTPTFNESESIAEFLDEVANSVEDVEIIVVDDDSPDRTWAVAQAYADRDSHANADVTVLRRFNERGLSSAVMSGLGISQGQYLIVMDSDGQHDPAIIRDLVQALRNGADLAVGSRNHPDGSYGSWPWSRRLASWLAAFVAKVLIHSSASDPMSGYFAITRDAYERTAPAVNPRGFKILLEFLGRNPDLSVTEVGYGFRLRKAGETKLNNSVARSYVVGVLDLRFGHMVKPQFLLYTLMGVVGVLSNLFTIVVGELLNFQDWNTGFGPPVESLPIPVVAGIAVQVLVTFALDNWFTFWENRWRGPNLIVGFALFSVISGYGLVLQFAVAAWLADFSFGESVLGLRGAEVLRTTIAILIAFQASYFVNLNLTWRRRIEDD